MDGGGRLAQPLTRTRQSRGARAAAPRRPRERTPFRDRLRRLYDRCALHGKIILNRLSPILLLEPPRGAGTAAAALLILLSGVYGAVKGGHVEVMVGHFKELRDAGGNALGFRIASVALVGQTQVTREEVLSYAGVTGRSSLLFLDAADMRARVKTMPWVADATVLKLYPDQLRIEVTERKPFALWQKDGRVSLIAKDGTVLEPFVAPGFLTLPLVVGRGAENKAREFLALLDRYPEIRGAVRASILVAERRWNLRLKNGVDVRLPESEIERALDILVTLDRERKLFSRDITAIDLRLADRVTVRLSDAAAQAREDASKDKKSRRKGSDA
jgi:cell division protein FtsQ